MLGLGLLLILAGVLVVAFARFARSHDVGILLVVAGVILVVLDVVDIDAEAHIAAAGAIPWWGRLDWRYRLLRRREKFALWLACRMPGWLRVGVVVDATNTARRLYPDATGYAGPDDLGYPEIHDGALRRRSDGR